MNPTGNLICAALSCVALGGCAAPSPTPDLPPGSPPDSRPAPAPGLPAGSDYDLYFLGGQSNMDGYGFVEQLPPGLRGSVARVRIFTGLARLDGETFGGIGLWQPLLPGHGAGVRNDGQTVTLSNRFGPELTFGRRLAELDPAARIALVKYSLGGSALAMNIGYGSWHPDATGPSAVNQYDHALATLANARKQTDVDGDGDGRADRLVPRGIVWMQGETDAFEDPSAAEAYRANLTRLMKLLRKALGDDDLPVVIGKITDSGMTPDGSIMGYIDTVQQAQRAFADADLCAALVTVTDEFGYIEDGWHYDTEGFLRLGAAFAEAMHDLQASCQGDSAH